MKGRGVFLVLALATIAILAWLAGRSSDDVATLGSREVVPRPPAIEPALEGGRHSERAPLAGAVTSGGPAEVASDSVSSDTATSDRATSAALVLLVTDDAGAPIRAAGVALRRGSLGLPIEEAVTDDAGRASLLQADVSDRIGVMAEGFEETRVLLPERPWAEPTVVVLQRGTEWLAGTLVDDTHAPVPDAAIVLIAHSTLFHARTDAEGRFVFRAPYDAPPPQASFDLPDGTHLAPAAGETLPWADWLALGWPRLVAERLAVLEITVLDPSGVAVADARVLVKDPPDPATGTWQAGHGIQRFVVAATDVDADGRPRYTIRARPGTPLWIEVGHGFEAVGWIGGSSGPRAYGRAEIGVLAPAERVARSVRLEAGEARALRFRVRDEDGAAVADAKAWVTELALRRGYLRKTEHDGRFSIMPPACDWTVSVRANGFAAWEGAYAASFAPDGTVEIVLTRSDIGIEVLVHDEHGRAFPGAGIGVYRESDGRQVATGPTDADGRFDWRGLEPGVTYRVEIGGGRPGNYVRGGASGWDTDLAPDPPLQHGVLAGTTRLEFRILPAGSIAGVVVGDVPPGASVELSGTASGRQEIASDGRFAFVGLPVGRYRVGVATDEGEQDVSLQSVEVEVEVEVEVAAGQDVVGVELGMR